MSDNFFDLAFFPILGAAVDGNMEPLAKWIEEGGALDAGTRKWLASYLRGETNRRPGLKRTYAQQLRESKTLAVLLFLQDVEEEARGKRGARARAIRAYLDIDPGTTERALKRYLSNYKKAKAEKRDRN